MKNVGNFNIEANTSDSLNMISFYDALKEIMNGKRVTKKEWNNQDIQMLMLNNTVNIRKEDGSIVPLLIRDIDIVGQDWIVVE